MYSVEKRLPLIVIVGPTAVGKTELSIQLAQQLNGEIISADSRLFYRGMDIGTAKPTSQERALIPHHLLDIADPDQTWSLARFQVAAHEAIAGIHQREHLPFLVGGTGQYIRAVVDGWILPHASDNRIRMILENMADQRGDLWLHAMLDKLDPDAAMGIDARNVRRTIRAFEVILITGRRFSDQRGRKESPYDTIIIGLNRPRLELYARVDARIDSMFASGFLEEVQSLLDAGYSPDTPALSAIGYRECVAILKGIYDLEEAKKQIKRASRIFVRRQANWFKPDDPRIKWFYMEENTLKKVEQYVHSRQKLDQQS